MSFCTLSKGPAHQCHAVVVAAEGRRIGLVNVLTRSEHRVTPSSTPQQPEHGTREVGASRRMLAITEWELQRILLDIHDGPVQHMYAALSQVDLMEAALQRSVGVDPEVVQRKDRIRKLLEDGLTEVRSFIGASYKSGGKTGTAQAIGVKANEKYNAAKLEEHKRDHSLYMAFAPAEDPKIALAVIVENAGFGAAHAAPIARRVFDYWLMSQYSDNTNS